MADHTTSTLPRLRAIEAFPVEADGKRLICLRDPLEYAAGPILVPEQAFFILASLDGAPSIVDIQAAFARRYGHAVSADEIRTLIATLDGHHYLESPAFMARRIAVDEVFLRATVRPAAHAGSSYPDDVHGLTQHLDDFFQDLPPLGLDGTLRGLIAPHIDLRVGGRAYGHAYRALAATSAAERFVILGTSHLGGGSLFAATRKDFATPLGVVPTDRAFLDRLAAHLRADLYEDELLHRVEHAVEFQVVLLQHVLGAGRPFTVVPILVTSFHELIRDGRTPADDARISEMIEALHTTLTQDGVPTTLIAGVDFAHVGTKFGDREGLTPALIDATEAKDRRLIAALEAADAEAFYAEVAGDADRTRICGLSPMYAFLRLIDTPGRLLHYDRSREETTDSSVTYASLAFGLHESA